MHNRHIWMHILLWLLVFVVKQLRGWNEVRTSDLLLLLFIKHALLYTLDYTYMDCCYCCCCVLHTNWAASVTHNHTLCHSIPYTVKHTVHTLRRSLARSININMQLNSSRLDSTWFKFESHSLCYPLRNLAAKLLSPPPPMPLPQNVYMLLFPLFFFSDFILFLFVLFLSNHLWSLSLYLSVSLARSLAFHALNCIYEYQHRCTNRAPNKTNQRTNKHKNSRM